MAPNLKLNGYLAISNCVCLLLLFNMVANNNTFPNIYSEVFF